MIRVASRRSLDFLTGWEGFRSCPYLDIARVWTIGYGTTSAVVPVSGQTPCIGRRQARIWLSRGLEKIYLPAIPRWWRLKARERAALTSFAYNNGPGAVSDPRFSTLARRLMGPEGRSFEGRCRIYRDELPRWIYAGGVKSEGLIKRRVAEVRLAVHGDYSGRP